MSSVQCINCQQWFTNCRNLMRHMASCPAKYNHLELLHHNPLKSTYDAHMSTNISVPSNNEDTTKLFEVEMKEIEGSDIAGSQHSTDGRDLDVGSPMIYMTMMITTMILIIPRLNLAQQCQRFKLSSRISSITKKHL